MEVSTFGGMGQGARPIPPNVEFTSEFPVTQITFSLPNRFGIVE